MNTNLTLMPAGIIEKTFNVAKTIALFLTFSTVIFSCKKEEFNPVQQHAYNNNLIMSPIGGQPNVILILADDIGYEVPTYTGGRSYSTPNLDALAQGNLQFTRFHATPLCSPSRVELLSGKYNFRNYTDWGQYNTDVPTIANLMKNAGYATCVAGKWQLNGGDSSIKKMGFDNYRVYLPYTDANEKSEDWYRYKNPHIYQNGTDLPADSTRGKYADDMFVDYISNFINNNQSKPFFVYFPFSLCHYPFVPTPDDPEYATWTPESRKWDVKYYPSMVQYLDKKVGQLLDKVNSVGLAQNTIIIFVSDNGTPKQITSLYDDQTIPGGKNSTNEYGTKVPCIVKWPGVIPAGTVSDRLTDLTDIMPTLADIAGMQIPQSFGTTDGSSFYPTLEGSSVNMRQTIYTYFKPHLPNKPKGWAQTETYKLYDSSNYNKFFNIIADPYEKMPLKLASLTADQKTVRQQLSNVIAGMHN